MSGCIRPQKLSIAQRTPVDILGVPVRPWGGEELIEAMIESATGKLPPVGRRLVTVHYANVHVLNTAYWHSGLRRQLRSASTVYCDGSGVRLGAALLGRRLPARVTAADWVDSFCFHAALAGVRLFIIAGGDGVARQAAAILQTRHSELLIAGTHHGFIDDSSSMSVVTQANQADADIVLVGMGTPAQELWVGRFRSAIQAPVVWTVGALFDFVVGTQRRSPRWLRDVHMEWLWRLATDPRRLGPRYLVGNPLFLFRVLKERLRGPGRL